MKKQKKTYSIFQMASAIFMMLALLWLTVSTPFVFASQQKMAGQHSSQNIESSFSDNPLADGSEEEANPFSNTTEEKNPNSSNSFSEEFLHHHHDDSHFFLLFSQLHKSENAGTYVAFHGELLVPPPNAA